MLEIISKVQKNFRKEYKFSFQPNLVGSGKRNLILKKGKSNWDLDYTLTINSKKIDDYSKPNDLFNLKNNVKTMFNNNTEDNYKVKLSKSVVTINELDEKGNLVRNYDFAIIKDLSETKKILRGKTISDCRWEELPNENYEKNISEIKGAKMWNTLREIYKDKKCANWETKEKTGISLFLESIKETIDKFQEK